MKRTASAETLQGEKTEHFPDEMTTCGLEPAFVNVLSHFEKREDVQFGQN